MIRPLPKPQLLIPKIQRLPRLMWMTIAAGFRCKDGIIVCADSQETIPDYVKIYGRKLVVCEHSDFKIALTGAGGADMLEMIFHAIMQRLGGPEYTVASLQGIISEVVYETYMKHVLPFPRDERPWFQILAGIQIKGEPAVLLKSAETVVTPVDHFSFVGSVAFAHVAVGGLDARSLPLSCAVSLFTCSDLLRSMIPTVVIAAKLYAFTMMGRCSIHHTNTWR